MFDGTVLLHDLLGSLWTTVNLSALIQQSHVELPFDHQLQEFLIQNQGSWNELMLGISQFCAVPAEMMERERLYSPWQKLSPTSTIYDAHGVTIEIIVANGDDKWIEIKFANQGMVQHLAQKALSPCLCRMTSQLFRTHKFFTGSESYKRPDIEACLLPLRDILGVSWHSDVTDFVPSLLELKNL